MKSWVGRIMLVVVSGIAALLLAEFGLRLAGHAPEPALHTVSESEFQRIPGIFAPNQRVVEQRGTEFEHVSTINALGYRGAEVPLEKPAGELRVLFAGDSFTWGHNVGDAETLPAQLEARLNVACAPARVLNAGLSGSTILGQGELIVRGLAADPDLVILMYHENDIDELMYVRIWDQLAANRSLKSRFPLSVVYPFLRRSATVALAADVRRSRYFRRQHETQEAVRAQGEEVEIERAREEYRTRLERIADLLADREIPLLFVAFPHPESVEAGRGGRDWDWVLRTAREAGLEAVDLLESLRNSGVAVDEAFLVPLDYHPSPRGHSIAAGVLEPYVVGRFAARCGH